MNLPGLSLRNLFYHRRGNLAVLLGVAVGCAVLTGALLVGDSLRGSLLQRTFDRLEWVGHALIASRFFREELVRDLQPHSLNPAIVLQGTATKGGPEAPPAAAVLRRVPGVTVLGVTQRFWPTSRLRPHLAPPTEGDFWHVDDSVALNAALAADLKASVGDRVT